MKKSLTLIFLLFTIVSISQQSGTITDARDGKVYKTVDLGNQTWMAENLNVSTFRNGDTIPEVKTTEEWIKAGKEGKPAWCYYDNDTANGRIYGKLYNWYAVDDKRGLAPKGWHIPSNNEYGNLNKSVKELINDDDLVVFDDRYNDHIMDFIKEKPIYELQINYIDEGGFYETKWIPCKNCSYWTEQQILNKPCSVCKNKRGKNVKTKKFIPKTQKKIEQKILVGGWNGINTSGFSALPAGVRNSRSGRFEGIGQHTDWFSDVCGPSVWSGYILDYDVDGMDIELYEKGNGLSVRCIKD